MWTTVEGAESHTSGLSTEAMEVTGGVLVRIIASYVGCEAAAMTSSMAFIPGAKLWYVKAAGNATFCKIV